MGCRKSKRIKKAKVEIKSSFSNNQSSEEDSQQVNVERNSSTSSLKREKNNQTQFMVPVTMKDSFFNDPFFKDTWTDIEKSHRSFFEELRKLFEQSLSIMESKLTSPEDIFKETDEMSIF